MKHILCCFLLYCCCFSHDVSAMCEPETSANFISATEVVAISDKDLSNVVLKFCDDTIQKFDDLSGLFGTFSGTGDNSGKKLVGIYIKSGCNQSDEGLGFGEFHVNLDDDVCGNHNCNNDDDDDDDDCCEDDDDDDSNACEPVCPQGYDECGVCGGEGSGECGCNSSVVKDRCDVCGGDNTSCQIEVCQVLDNDYDNAKVVVILESELDETKHFDVAECKPTVICIRSGWGPTVTVPWIAFYNKYLNEGSGLGECRFTVCVKSEDGRFAIAGFVLESEFAVLIEEGRATGDLSECDNVKVCINPNTTPPTTKLIPKFVLDWYLSNGFKEGECPIKVCRPGIENEADATVIEIDLSEKLETDRFVEDCEPMTICLDGQTLTLPKFVAIPIIVNDGANQGECNGECPTHNECVTECSESYDPLWVPQCVAFCVENCGIYCDKPKDCIFTDLEPETCANANGFLGQVNIATVVNTSQKPLRVQVQYRDLFGVVQGQIANTVETKWDVIVNDIGLLPDTYGTVCVQTDAEEAGKWIGGVTLYKGIDDNAWGGPYEFALYYPFENFKIGFQATALNTHDLGGSATANWIRITDGEIDNHPLGGSLFIYGGDGTLEQLHDVHIPDGGRFDFSAHDALGHNKLGTAIFAPHLVNGKSPNYYFSSARYTYNCVDNPNGFACNDFLTAFVTPNRTPIKGITYNQVSSVGELTYLELHNPVEKTTSIRLSVFSEDGIKVHNETIQLTPYQVRHLAIYNVLDGVGHAKLNSENYYIAGRSSYKLESSIVEFGYSTAFTRLTPNSKQMTEYNSFLNQSNTVEVTNTLERTSNGTIKVIDYLGNVVFDAFISAAPNTTTRYKLNIPVDSYGVIIVDAPGVFIRNYVVNDNQYTLPFIGK